MNGLLHPSDRNFLLVALILVLILAPCSLAIAQEDAPEPVRTFTPYTGPARSAPLTVDTPTVQRTPGNVTIKADPGIEGLMQQFTEHAQVTKGYRVQIHLGERGPAEEVKRAFLQKHPDIPAYLSWLPPNFRIRVGDFRTRLEAERLLRELKTEHPGSYIVPDDIEAPSMAIKTK